MSIVGLVIEKGNIIIAGDTRVIIPSKIEKEVGSRFDFAIKVFKITPNIIIGIVGEYTNRTLNIISKIHRELNKTDYKGDFYWSYRNYFIMEKIQKTINDFSEISIDIIVAMHEMRSGRRHAYKLLKIVDYKPYKIDKFDFIGLNPELHSEIIINYQKGIVKNNPESMEDYANTFLESIKPIVHITINEFPICYVIHDNGIKTISNGTGYIGEDGNVNWVVNTLDENDQWVRKVNGKTIGNIISDFGLIQKKLNQEFK